MDTSLNEEGDDSEEEIMTAAQVYEKIEEAWMSEKFSPDLLDSHSELVECMLEQIAEMEKNIQRVKKADIKVHIHRMEIDRIRYVLSSYLRCRLFKVEKFASHLIDQQENGNEKMSSEELAYAKEHKLIIENHLKTLAVRNMPPNMQAVDAKEMNIEPNLNSYVFLQVNQNIEGVMVEEGTDDSDEQIIDLDKGDQHILRYKLIADLVGNSSVQLI